jgi:hypothetical protein
MKALITALLAVALLSGCVAVPYYAEPAPAGYYYGPPASVQFNYGYYGGPRHYHHHYYR